MFTAVIVTSNGRTSAIIFTERSNISLVVEHRSTGWTPVYGIDPDNRQVLPAKSVQGSLDPAVLAAINKALNK